ncbi:MAG: putative binding protein, partial [Acidimicrobiia bacterium]|nr:putative binding protein [Acidimicrobiia bacterium]
LFVEHLAARYETKKPAASQAIAQIWPTCSAQQAWRRLRNAKTLKTLGADPDLITDWLKVEGDGALFDEVRARFEGVPARYSHIIVDEAQDISLFALRAVIRRADGLTLVGDDAQRSNPFGVGLQAAAELLEVTPEVMNIAYRMSAEIATWLNEYATAQGIEAIILDGIRPTGISVRSASDVAAAEADLRQRWANVAVIGAEDVWDHKGVEYDAVVVNGAGSRPMTPPEVYLAASRAAHELVTVGV